MTDLPYFPQHVNDAIANSEELTNEELGAYVRLQRALWRAGGYLPADPRKLARFSRAGKRWGAIAAAIMGKLTVLGEKVSCPDVLRSMLMANERRARAADAANIRHHGRSRVSDGIASHTSDDRLNPRKPLKVLESIHARASSEHMLEACNQNQKKNLESKSLSASDAAAGGRANEELSPDLINVVLYGEGVDLLVKRVGLRELAARSQIAKWLYATGDSEELAALLTAAGKENLRGAQLIAVVDQRVATAKRERERGAPLPFGFQPNVVRSKGPSG